MRDSKTCNRERGRAVLVWGCNGMAIELDEDGTQRENLDW